jgi:hypothetical protein
MLSQFPVVLTLPIERPVFLKEENSKLYTVFSYFIGSTTIDIPLAIIYPLYSSGILFWMSGMYENY